MESIWFFEQANMFSLLCPHKFKAYKKQHNFNTYKKSDYIYFEEDNANISVYQLANFRDMFTSV